jgi:SAM-dependent methyltransferase
LTLHILDLALDERRRYSDLWALPDYAKYSPGERDVERFISTIEPRAGQSLIDLGCGSGIAGLKLGKDARLNVTWLDITDAGLFPAVPRARFIQSALWDHWPREWDYHYGYCVDVMEHIPPECVMLCIDRILSACRVTWFSVCLRPDAKGALIGEQLHLTVRPFNWWKTRMALLGNVLDARDLINDALFVVERKRA